MTTTHREYKPDMRMRQATERAREAQPPLISITSKVQPDYSAVRDRSELKGKA